MKHILVTGANGQLGSELQELTRNNSPFTFYFTDIDTLDIADKAALEQFFAENPVDMVVNCAAYTAVDKAEEETKQAHRVNVEAPMNLARCAKKHAARLIHVSTDYVFNGEHFIPYTEEHPPNPQSAYGESKLLGEEAVKTTLTEYMIIRTSWLYSSFGHNFLKTMLRLGQERQQLTVVFDQIGTPTYARDLAQAILTLLRQVADDAQRFVSGVYHFSNEGVCSWYDFAKEIMETASLECQILPIETKDYPTPAKRPYYSVLNKQKIKATYGLTIPHWKDSARVCLHKLLRQK